MCLDKAPIWERDMPLAAPCAGRLCFLHVQQAEMLPLQGRWGVMAPSFIGRSVTADRHAIPAREGRVSLVI